MDALRYWIAVFTMVAFPPALVFWLIVHPFAARWRRLGSTPSLAILYPSFIAAMVGLFALRDRLVVGDLGASASTAVLGGLCFAASLALLRGVRRELPVRTQMGLPELTADPSDDRLVTEGIYARIRHPRYVQIWLSLLAYALMANYAATYLLVVLAVPLFWAVVAAEERELGARFGSAWEAYARRVPRFVPSRQR